VSFQNRGTSALEVRCLQALDAKTKYPKNLPNREIARRLWAQLFRGFGYRRLQTLDTKTKCKENCRFAKCNQAVGPGRSEFGGVCQHPMQKQNETRNVELRNTYRLWGPPLLGSEFLVKQKELCGNLTGKLRINIKPGSQSVKSK
jgi:hypothetical protein